MNTCLFCRIARKEIGSVIIHEDEELLAFLDTAPIRPGHTLIVPKRHFDSFEVLPSELAAQILTLGQQLARRMKVVYALERVGFAFTGTDVAHTHAHVVPIHQRGDITSARYIVGPTEAVFDSKHLEVDHATLERAREQLGFSRDSA